MKILFISPSHEIPALKGYQVMLNRHIELLADSHTIDLITFTDSNDKISNLNTIKHLCNNIEVIRLPKWKMLFNLLMGLFSIDPFQVCIYRSKRMSKAVENRLKSTNYDAVIFQLARTAQFLPIWYEGIALLNMIDPLVFNYKRSLVWRPWYLRIALNFEINRLRFYESKQIPRFDRVFLITKKDVSDYKNYYKEENFENLTYGIDTVFFKPDKNIDRVPGMIVISGNMSYAPNIDGVIFFCEEVLPLILAKYPNAHLWIVGVQPSRSIKKLSLNKNITVTGYVDDIRYYLHRAMVSLCPIRLNVGIQTKVLEALATGTPVVTTSAGNQGVCGESGRHLYVADSPTEISNSVLFLLNNYTNSDLTTNGRKFVQDNFQWTKSAHKLESIVNELVSQKLVIKGCN